METLTSEQAKAFTEWFFNTGYNAHAAGKLTDQVDRMLAYYKMHVVDNDFYKSLSTPSTKRLKDTG